MSTRKTASLALLCFAAALGCRGAPVGPSDLAGVWTVAGESRALLPEFGPTAAMRIELRPDGTFAANELPGDLLYVTDRERGLLASGGGRWRVRALNAEQKVELEFRTIEIGGHPGDAPFVTYLDVSQTRSGSTVSYMHGDPDAGARVDFERLSGASPVQARSMCTATAAAFAKQDAKEVVAILERHLGVPASKMRASREGIFVPTRRRLAEEGGYFVARPGVSLERQQGSDPSFEAVEGCLYRYRIKG